MARANLAALSPDGSPATQVRGHSFNGAVLTLSTDGSSVFAGGAFTVVDGAQALRVARFAAGTGNRLAFASGVSGTVHASTLAAGRLYIGGKFTSVQGNFRGNLAALSPATGALVAGWAPTATLLTGDARPNDPSHNNVPVRSLAAAPEGNRIYVAGDMDRLNGAARPAIGAVDPASGATVRAFSPPAALNKGFQGFQIATVAGGAGRPAGIILAAGGVTNRAFRLGLGGSIEWTVETDGDVQAAAVIGNSVYLGGHFTCTSTRSCLDADQTADTRRIYIAAFPYAAAGRPAADPSWAPALVPTASPYFFGVWTLEAFDGVLYAGGVFNAVTVGTTTFRQPKFARFR